MKVIILFDDEEWLKDVELSKRITEEYGNEYKKKKKICQAAHLSSQAYGKVTRALYRDSWNLQFNSNHLAVR